MLKSHLVSFFLAATFLVLSVEGCSVLDDMFGAAHQEHHRARRDTNKQYSYDNTDHWKKDFVHACADNQQSPVNIALNKCEFPSNLTQLKITGWNVVPLKTILKATGKTVEFWNTYESEKPRITGGPLGNNVYGLYQFHFHWGEDEFEGSEHLIENDQYPMESHFVFMNEKYSNPHDALKNKDGLAVIGRFYEINEKAAAPSFVKHLKELYTRPSVAIESGIPLSDVSPSTTWDYVSYAGGLTTPPCYEIVTWIVAVQNNMQIADATIEKFRRMSKEKRVYRAVQPFNKRKLTCSFQ